MPLHALRLTLSLVVVSAAQLSVRKPCSHLQALLVLLDRVARPGVSQICYLELQSSCPAGWCLCCLLFGIVIVAYGWVFHIA
jgi:hypothetical protein